MEEQQMRLKAKEGSGYGRLVEGCDAVLAKLQKYLKKAEANPVYLAAVVCDPSKRFEFVRWMYKKTPEWIVEAEKTLRSFFERFLDKSHDHIEGIQTTEEVTGESTWENWLNKIPKMTITQMKTAGDEEFRNYFSLPALTQETAGIPWWQDNGSQFSTWQKIAFTLLPIPASLAKVERIFSRAVSFALEKLMKVWGKQ